LQHQAKRLSATRVLVAEDNRLAGYYTLATGQVDFGDLPPDLSNAATAVSSRRRSRWLECFASFV